MLKINSIYDEIFASYPQIEIEEHIKKIIELDYFQPFNSTFFCITNTVNKKFEYISKNFTACTGVPREKMENGGMDYFWSLFHKDDIEPWLNCLKDLMDFTMNHLSEEERKRMNYTWNYRIKNDNGEYITIIQNTTPLQFDQQNKPVIGLAHYTVINENSNMDICATAKYLNDNNEYETLFFKNVSSNNLLCELSNRERDILRLLITKKTSVEIAEKLNISKHTVDTHRRNILKKLNLSSTLELTNYLQKNKTLL